MSIETIMGNILSHNNPPKIAMLSTGEEVLFGDITDTNASWLSASLFEAGFQMTTRMTVGDSLDAISTALKILSKDHDVVIINGGLGPTSDDLTAEAASLCAAKDLELFPQWVERIEQMFAQWGREMPPSNIKQAMLPSTSVILDNPRGTACGFRLDIDGAQCYFTPGVPHEFKSMLNNEILPHMQACFTEIVQKNVHRIYCYGLSESGIATLLEPLEHPKQMVLGYRSALPYIEVKLFYSECSDEVQAYINQVEALLDSNSVAINCPPVNAVFDKLGGRRVAIIDGITQGHFHSWIAKQLPEQDKLSSFNVPIDHQQAQGLQLAKQVGLDAHDYCFVLQGLSNNQWQFTLKTPKQILKQVVEFKRDYNFSARCIVVSAIALDMLRRNVNECDPWGEYGSVVRVSSNIQSR
ncbi:molybdopterin-binding protein [Vibrio gallicus]|uniref:molybdopterin-binding protein n=1 Tax=Vibrio gallicus TaxID=190897 RepID=UPI0021C3AC8C|nr:molybdopterin-binding protein [Vibrio gallicus]